MIKLIPKLTSALCLAVCSFSNAQTPNQDQKPNHDESANGSNELVCKLTGPEFNKRLEELRTIVFAKVESYQEVEKGYVFHFKDEGDLLQKLTDYMLSERKCCAFFDFNLLIKSNEAGAVLTISGPDGAKEMIKMVLNK